ncbi:MAG: C25 family cysteine peptidase [bacterium]
MSRAAVLVLAIFLTGTAVAEDGARFLIIAYDNYADAVQPLAKWRQAAGISTRLVLTSETGTDTAAIRNYIYNAWSTWPTRPEYVLIVGSPSNIRAYSYGRQQWRYYSDNYYGDMTGSIQAEIAVGRFPARSVTDAELMVAKTLAYEREPYREDSLWMLRLTTIVREGGDFDDTIYWNNSRNLARLAGENGFVACDSLSTYRGHNVSHVYNSVNTGTGFVMYRGTAGGWWRDPFNVNPYNTANGTKLPIILSMTCETMSLDPYDVLLGQYWVYAGTTADPAGAVAFFGNTYSAVSVARQRGAVARGVAAGLFSDRLDRLGPITLRGKQQLLAEFPSDTFDYRGFNVLGDPCLAVWTGRPLVLEVARPREILTGPQDLDVTVTHEGAPVANAVVCASLDSTVWTVDTTDADGRAALAIDPPHIGSLRLVVTGRNLVPFDGTIPVVPELGVAGPALPPLLPGFRFEARPTVASGPVRFKWSDPVAWRLEVTDKLGRTVRTVDADGRTALAWDGRDGQDRPARAGVYFARLVDRAGRGLASCRLLRLD